LGRPVLPDGPLAKRPKDAAGSGFGGLRRARRACCRFSAFQVGNPTATLLNLVKLLTHNCLYIPKSIRLFSRTMKFRLGCFNTYLLLSLLVASALGCQSVAQRQAERKSTREQRKAFATLRVHLEYPNGPTNKVSNVEIFGVPTQIHKDPFLTELNLTGASLVDTPDGLFGMSVQFDRHGITMLDSVTTQFRGRRLAFFCQYGIKKEVTTTWLAAPMIVRPVIDGRLQFTPVSKKEEAEKIILGLNNRIRINKKEGTTW
jgi:hypothetical protein